MIRKNNQSNRLIKWIVIVGDFVVLNVLVWAFVHWHPTVSEWEWNTQQKFLLICNIALMLSETQFSTIIHERVAGAGDILKRVVGLTILLIVLAYLLMKKFCWWETVGKEILLLGTLFFFILILKRLQERWFIKLYREAGRNSRTVTLVGSDLGLVEMYEKLKNDPTLGYRIRGYYGDEAMLDMVKTYEQSHLSPKRKHEELQRLGSMEDFMTMLDHPDDIRLDEELYLCVSRKEKELVKRVSAVCDRLVTRFYYVPVSVESLGISLKRVMVDDMEIFTTYENPLQNPINKAVKRVFDIVLSTLFLIPTAILFPFIVIIIKIQSPGPILFKQKRTGLDGKTFNCYKFRSMHVNKDADKVQATKDDPRKFPFGNFMRKTNIDELPQFYNVLQGRMSIVGPRPHMLAHTEQYSHLIDKYMVRHFVKPGVTGWAQVTGFRGETKELWQMEGRVKRDIWYMENWSIWLDIRIIWLTIKATIIQDKNAY